KLEQKARAELAAIVEAMGGKAGSRAKKADLVDQVLELAGQGNGRATRTAHDSAMPADAPSEVVAVPASASPPAQPALDEPPAEWELAVTADAPVEPAVQAPASTEQPPDQRDEPRRDRNE